jgi:lipopolysaccharide/colanic/teichoic acid biosynthesis glycosyltransferase
VSFFTKTQKSSGVQRAAGTGYVAQNVKFRMMHRNPDKSQGKSQAKHEAKLEDSHSLTPEA